LAKVTYRVVTLDVLSSADIETLATKVREQASRFHVVGVRFTKDGNNVSANPFYAWLLFWDGHDTVRNIMSTSETQTEAASTLNTSLLNGEVVVGMWEDVDTIGGIVALTVQYDRVWLRQIYSDGSGVGERYRLKEELKNRRWVALYHQGPLGTFKADGQGAHKVTVELKGKNLLMFDEGSIEASFAGEPFGSIARTSLLPRNTLNKGPLKKVGGPLKSARDALNCIAKETGPCLTRRDIVAIGRADNATSTAKAICEYPPIEAAKRLSDAALLIDEGALIEGWVSWYESADEADAPARGSERAAAYCAGLLQKYGPEGSELKGFISPPM
jgi:hypothetical protein